MTPDPARARQLIARWELDQHETHDLSRYEAIRASLPERIAAFAEAEMEALLDDLRAAAEALKAAHEWAAKFPLKGSASSKDEAASVIVYELAEAALDRPGVKAVLAEPPG